MSELNFFPKTSAHLYGKYYASIYESEIPHIIVFGPAHFVAFESGWGQSDQNISPNIYILWTRVKYFVSMLWVPDPVWLCLVHWVGWGQSDRKISPNTYILHILDMCPIPTFYTF